jgi:hypothetical protein
MALKEGIVIKQLAAAAAATTSLFAAAMGSTGTAEATADITARGWHYVNLYGNTVICATLDHNHTFDGIYGVMTSIESDGFGAYEAGGILLASIQGYCMRNMPLVIEFVNAGPDGPVSVVAAIDGPNQVPTPVH